MEEKVHGRCMAMCPASEIAFRSKNGRIHPLELACKLADYKATAHNRGSRGGRRQFNSDSLSIHDPKKMVKEYSRSAAGKELKSPDTLRPFPILMKTIRYLNGLFEEYRNSSDWPLTYEFVGDRFRAVRQDMIVQDLAADETADILEAMIPFYVEAQYRCEQTECTTYDWKLHHSQTDECFSRWKACCKVLGKRSETILVCYLIRNAEKQWSLNELYKWSGMLSEDYVKFSKDFVISVRMANIVRYFRIMGLLKEDLLSYASRSLVSRLRHRALLAYLAAYRCKGTVLPLNHLERVLNLDAFSLKKCLEELGVKDTNGNWCSYGVNINDDVNLLQTHWNCWIHAVGLREKS